MCLILIPSLIVKLPCKTLAMILGAVDGIKIFDKYDQAAKHCSFILNVLQPGHLYQKF